MTRALTLLLLSLFPTAAFAGIVWRGDFETGDASQWSQEQKVSADRLQITQSPVTQGSYAIKATVKQGDNPIHASGNRNELVYLSHEAPGSEYFYKWSTMFAPNFPSVNKWQLFTQWHQEDCCGSPPVEFYVVGEQLRMRVGGTNGTIVWTAPLLRGTWHTFVLHVKWSTNPSIGFVELYFDGGLATPKTMLATQFGNALNYLKMGLYRHASIVPDGVVFHDGMTMATTLADVMPPPPAPPAPPAPVAPPAANSTPPAAPPATDSAPPAAPPPTAPAAAAADRAPAAGLPQGQGTSLHLGYALAGINVEPPSGDPGVDESHSLVQEQSELNTEDGTLPLTGGCAGTGNTFPAVAAAGLLLALAIPRRNRARAAVGTKSLR